MLTRRRALLAGLGGLAVVAAGGGGAYALVETDVLPGRVRLDRTLGRCGALPAPPPQTAAVHEARYRSKRRRTEVGWSLVHPSGHPLRGLPVAVVLHGLGGDHASAVADLALDHYLGQAMARGVPPFALLTVDGGGTYWHRRASGDDPVAMVTDELLPHLRRLGLRTGPADRIGLYGYSMGGYGALLAAERLGPARVAAVAAASPALFASYDAARGADSGAFDDAADFARNDVMRALPRLRAIPAWVGCGRSDVFTEATERIRRRLTAPRGGISPGCHDTSYWRRTLPDVLAFLGRHLGGR
ncbi:MAG TPA: alpha/beta hydrolase-fold protein [Streptosporangiaceae bacterium]|jgi:enterochelin esterase-like enzyme